MAVLSNGDRMLTVVNFFIYLNASGEASSTPREWTFFKYMTFFVKGNIVTKPIYAEE